MTRIERALYLALLVAAAFVLFDRQPALAEAGFQRCILYAADPTTGRPRPLKTDASGTLSVNP